MFKPSIKLGRQMQTNSCWCTNPADQDFLNHVGNCTLDILQSLGGWVTELLSNANHMQTFSQALDLSPSAERMGESLSTKHPVEKAFHRLVLSSKFYKNLYCITGLIFGFLPSNKVTVWGYTLAQCHILLIKLKSIKTTRIFFSVPQKRSVNNEALICFHSYFTFCCTLFAT